MQKRHAAREVFLTQQVDNNGVESLWKPAQVCLPDACEKALGDDVFVCEYEYDTVFQVRLLPPHRKHAERTCWLTDRCMHACLSMCPAPSE